MASDRFYSESGVASPNKVRNGNINSRANMLTGSR
jgi:hypothetical protein